jgi:hypothetical protein
MRKDNEGYQSDHKKTIRPIVFRPQFFDTSAQTSSHHDGVRRPMNYEPSCPLFLLASSALSR